MRKNLKQKISALVEKLGPEIFEDFDSNRIVKRNRGSMNSLLLLDGGESKSRASGGSFISNGGAVQFNYYQ